MSKTPLRTETASPLEYALSVAADPGKRISALVVVAYAAGASGLVLSLFGNPADPRSSVGVAGIVLMGLSFLCMFVLSVTVLNVTDGPTERGRHR